MVDLVVLGSVGYDSIKTPFGSADNVLGGAATYASIAASFFAKPGVVAVVGEDFSGMDKFLSRNISTDGIKIVKGMTFRWSGYYEYDMNEARTVETQMNVFEGFSPALPESYKKAKSVFLGNIDPGLQLSVLKQMRPELVVADTMNYWIENRRDALFDVIKKSTIFLLNDGEARQLFSTTSLAAAGKKILSLGAKAAVIKKGEHGVLLFTDSSVFMLPGYPLENVVDPTGAGDSFGGALSGCLLKNGLSEQSLRKAVVYGSAVASFSVEDFGTSNLERITMSDIERRYREFEAMIRF
ncbi:MAG: sugar kinase [Candidatus Aenigmarchaeota archaeon]|nr:sugar kinase [Candidatus Aenigmarchaeota archaeon]